MITFVIGLELVKEEIPHQVRNDVERSVGGIVGKKPMKCQRETRKRQSVGKKLPKCQLETRKQAKENSKKKK